MSKVLEKIKHPFNCSSRENKHVIIAYSVICALLLFTIIDRACDWSNMYDLINDNYSYGLASGAVDPAAKKTLFIFVLIGTIFAFAEIGNAVTLLRYDGHLLLPAEIEQGCILVMYQLPKAIINLSVTICRNNIVTTDQAWSCFWGLTNSALRLYAYGYLREKFFPIHRGTVAMTTKIAYYITSSFFWVFLCVINIFLWHHARIAYPQFSTHGAVTSQLRGVSITLLSTAHHPHFYGNATSKAVHEFEIIRDSFGSNKAWLVQDIADIREKNDSIVSANYTCKTLKENKLQPPICQETQVTLIKFTFKYVFNKRNLAIEPAGELQYNLAAIRLALPVGNVTCSPADQSDLGSWKLQLIRFLIEETEGSKNKVLLAKRAWDDVCMSPKIRFNNEIEVC